MIRPTQTLGPDWEVDTRYQEETMMNYRARVWTDGRRAVAIAPLEGRRPGARQVLTVLFPADD